MVVQAILEALYPSRCALCGEFDPRPICPTCRAEMPAHSPLEPAPSPVNSAAAVHAYDGRPAQAVRRLKYERVLTHAAEMAEELAAVAGKLGMLGVDVVTPVPIHWSRKCMRGFNQSELLAEHLPNVRTDLLRRVKRTRQQVGLTPDQRRQNLAGAFQAEPEVSGKSVLLVDDVVTSGGTARESARALLAAGAYRVDLITYCAGGSIDDP